MERQVTIDKRVAVWAGLAQGDTLLCVLEETQSFDVALYPRAATNHWSTPPHADCAVQAASAGATTTSTASWDQPTLPSLALPWSI